MADPKISARDKEIFRRVALRGDSPEDVAAFFDIKRNNVDQIKARMKTSFGRIRANTTKLSGSRVLSESADRSLILSWIKSFEP